MRRPSRPFLAEIAGALAALAALAAGAGGEAIEPGPADPTRADALSAEGEAAAPVAAAPDGTPATAPDALPGAPDPDAQLTAREIYRRVLDNRFDASVQEYALASGDRAGNVQELRISQLWKRYPEGAENEDVLSRTLIRYMEPADLRQTAYLVINKQDQPNDQFVYLRSTRRVRRVNLRNEAIAGTDLSVEDLVPRELDDAEYVRIPDEDVEGTTCFVVEATPKPEVESVYSRFWLYVEKEHYVPLRIRYWDRKGVEIKEMRSPASSIREIEGIWIPIEATMRHLLEETRTSVKVDLLIPNPDLPDRLFSERELHAKRLRLPEGVMERARKL